jgi:formate-dependent nitrite reductase membrane component NrfD
MKLFSTWTGVLIVALLAAAMLPLAYIQYSKGQHPTALISCAGIAIVAMVMARRIARRK